MYPDLEVIGMASDGLEVVQMADEYRPDVILMDMQMPVMDGLEATRLVKSKWPTIKVIALAMYVGHKDEALSAGVDAHLLKGFEAEILHSVILDTLRKSISKSIVSKDACRHKQSRPSLRQE